jgi:hypothetical protein
VYCGGCISSGEDKNTEGACKQIIGDLLEMERLSDLAHRVLHAVDERLLRAHDDVGAILERHTVEKNSARQKQKILANEVIRLRDELEKAKQAAEQKKGADVDLVGQLRRKTEEVLQLKARIVTEEEVAGFCVDHKRFYDVESNDGANKIVAAAQTHQNTIKIFSGSSMSELWKIIGKYCLEQIAEQIVTL